MYTDSIKTENKIISYELLLELFNLMHENQQKLLNQFEQEKKYNENIEYSNQKWTLKLFTSDIIFNVNFYDSTEVRFDDYEKFLNVFETRLSEIKSMDCTYHINYLSTVPNDMDKAQYQRISFHLSETRATFDFSLINGDNKLNEIYDFIKDKIESAPDKYDETIKNKRKIMLMATFATGLVPGMIISLVFLFIPIIGDVMRDGYIIYPIFSVLFGYFIGIVLNRKMQGLYNNLIKDKKYLGYDVDNKITIYGDDIDEYKSKSEVLIGANSNNMKYREEIKLLEDKYSKALSLELILLLLITLFIIIIFNFITL